MSYLFFAAAGAQEAPVPPGEGYTVSLWRPDWLHMTPPEGQEFAFKGWAAMHQLHMVSNRDYGVLLIYAGKILAHRACLLPACFRFPFMGPNDLLIGNAWTHPDHAEIGLESFALRHLIRVGRAPGRTFWVVANEDDQAAVRAAEQAGFRKIGRGDKHRRLGLNLLAVYAIHRQRTANPLTIR
jgi:hypothetical protein